MDLNSIYDWIKTNPMKPAFMIAELNRIFREIKCSINLGANGELILLQQVSDDPKYISLILTNSKGDDLLSFTDINFEHEYGALIYVHNNKHVLFPIKTPSLSDSPDIRDVELVNGNYIITNEKMEIIISKQLDKTEENDIIPEVEEKPKRGRKKKDS